MPSPNAEALKLPDALLVRYYRAGEIDRVADVIASGSRLTVVLAMDRGESRRDSWTDLGGGLGYVPDARDD
jgi:hypothetical protein